MPEAKLHVGMPNVYKRFIVQNFGMVTGFIIMVLIAIYEEDIGQNFE